MQVIADRIGRQEVLLLMNHNRYNYWKKMHFGQKSPVGQVFKVSNSYILEVP